MAPHAVGDEALRVFAATVAANRAMTIFLPLRRRGIRVAMSAGHYSRSVSVASDPFAPPSNLRPPRSGSVNLRATVSTGVASGWRRTRMSGNLLLTDAALYT